MKIFSKNSLAVACLVALAIGGVSYGLHFTAAFTGPAGSGGTGSGALSADPSGNLSLGTTTLLGTSRFYIVGSSTNSSYYALSVHDQAGDPLFLVRNDGKVSVATSSFSTSTFRVLGRLELASSTSATGGITFPDGTTQVTAGGSSISAAQVSFGAFGSASQIGNYTFPASVAIGTTTAPGSTLQVTGHLALSGGSTLRSAADFNNYFLPYELGTGRMALRTGGVDRVSIASTGNVAIATTTPLTTFHIAGASTGPDAEVGSLLITAGPSKYRLALGYDNSNNYGWIQAVENGVNYKPIVLNKAGGNVGIGTTNPLQRLHVTSGSGSLNNSYFTTNDFNSGTNTGSAFAIDFGAASGNTYTRLTAASAGVSAFNNLILQSGGGNVGIGTTTPSTKLHVVGGARITGLASCNGIATDANGVLACNSPVLGSGTSGYVPKWSGTDTLTTSLIRDNGSQIGLGGAPDSGGIFLKVNGGGMSVAGAVLPTSDGAFGMEMGASGQRWRTAHAVDFYGALHAGPDLAERYLSADDLQPGDLVSKDLSRKGYWVKRAAPGETATLMGIVSTAPGVILSEPQVPSGPHDNEFSSEGYPIALTGRVPVKVSTENGPIAEGDYLTLSSQAGVAMKLTGAGKSVAMALESYDGPGIGKVLGFVGGPRDMLIAPAASHMDVATALESLEVTIKKGIVRAKEFIAEKIAAHTVATDGLEMKDQATGETYCVHIVSGEFEKTKGSCL